MGLKWFYYCSGFKSGLINFLTMNLLIKGSSVEVWHNLIEKIAISRQVGWYALWNSSQLCSWERERERERSLLEDLLFLNRETCDGNWIEHVWL